MNGIKHFKGNKLVEKIINQELENIPILLNNYDDLIEKTFNLKLDSDKVWKIARDFSTKFSNTNKKEKDYGYIESFKKSTSDKGLKFLEKLLPKINSLLDFENLMSYLSNSNRHLPKRDDGKNSRNKNQFGILVNEYFPQLRNHVIQNV